MEIKISARHMELTSALVDYIHKKLQKVYKYFNQVHGIQVNLGCEKHRRTASIVLSAGGILFRAQETSSDLYAAVDLVSDKIDLQLKKHKEKLKVHHFGENSSIRTLHLKNRPIPGIPITGHETILARLMSLDEASAALEHNRKKLLVFINPDTNQPQILIKKNNGYHIVDIAYD
jgi:putative sigma-54 modulation protein